MAISLVAFRSLRLPHVLCWICARSMTNAFYIRSLSGQVASERGANMSEVDSVVVGDSVLTLSLVARQILSR